MTITFNPIDKRVVFERQKKEIIIEGPELTNN